MFGNIDARGSKAIRAFAEADVGGWHRHFQTLFEYIDVQKIRTPKGLDRLKAQYPTLTQNELMFEMQAIGMMRAPSTQLFEPGCCRTPPPSSRRQRQHQRCALARARGIGAKEVNGPGWSLTTRRRTRGTGMRLSVSVFGRDDLAHPFTPDRAVPPVTLVRAESSCARGAPSQRRRSAERPTFRWSAARPAIQADPLAPRPAGAAGGAARLLAAGATSFERNSF